MIGAGQGDQTHGVFIVVVSECSTANREHEMTDRDARDRMNDGHSVPTSAAHSITCTPDLTQAAWRPVPRSLFKARVARYYN